MKNVLSGVFPPLLAFALFTLVGLLLNFENVRSRAMLSPAVTLSDQVIVPDNIGNSDPTVPDVEISDAQNRVLELRNQLAEAQLLANPDPVALRQLQLAELERQRQEWERNLQTVHEGSYAIARAEFSGQAVEIHNDYFFDNLALDPFQRSAILAALTDIEREKTRLYEELRLGRLTQTEYDTAIADIRSEGDIWQEALSETQFPDYQDLQAARTRQNHLATAVTHATNSTGPMSDQGRELLIAAYAGLLEKQDLSDSSTSNPAQVYETRLADFTEMADWLAPQLSGYDNVALETFLGYRGIELQERFLMQLNTPSPAVMP